MVRIIGSAKIDDYRKVVLEAGVMKSLDVKPGDSLLFFKKEHDSTLSVYKAEGATVTNECDSAPVRHMKEEPKRLRTYVVGIIGLMFLMLFPVAMNLESIDMTTFIIFVVFWVLGFCVASLTFLRLGRIDAPNEAQTLVTVGGPYTKNRLLGLSKLNDDGYAVSGELYINSLFGANPQSVEVEMQYENGGSETILTKCTQIVPGYTVYKMRFKDEGLEAGKLTVCTTFGYIGKSIKVVSEFDVGVAQGKNSKSISITEGPVSASMEFDEKLNSTGFDEILFDPTEEEDTF